MQLGIEMHVVSHLFFSATQQTPTSEAGFSSECQLIFSKHLWESLLFYTLAPEPSVAVGYGQVDTIIYFIQLYNVPIGQVAWNDYVHLFQKALTKLFIFRAPSSQWKFCVK